MTMKRQFCYCDRLFLKKIKELFLCKPKGFPIQLFFRDTVLWLRFPKQLHIYDKHTIKSSTSNTYPSCYIYSPNISHIIITYITNITIITIYFACLNNLYAIAAAPMPPTFVTLTYTNAIPTLLASMNCSASTLNVLKVVNDPQNPVPSNKLVCGLRVLAANAPNRKLPTQRKTAHFSILNGRVNSLQINNKKNPK